MFLLKSIVVCMLSIYFFFGSIEATENVERIQKEVLIREFIHYLFVDEGFAYVLFGSKPMAVCSQDKSLPNVYKELYDYPPIDLHTTWPQWREYSHSRPSKDFIFFAQDGERWFEVFLLNKQSCLKIIDDNLFLFQKHLGPLSSDEIITHLVSSSNLFEDGLNQSQALYGLLLGYGKNNSLGFERHYAKKPTKHFVNNSLRVTKTPIPQEGLTIPSFASFSNRETHKLMRQYSREREQIENLLSTHKPSQAILQTLLN